MTWLALWFALCAIVYDANNQETPVSAGVVAAVVALAIVGLIESLRRRRTARALGPR